VSEQEDTALKKIRKICSLAGEDGGDVVDALLSDVLKMFAKGKVLDVAAVHHMVDFAEKEAYVKQLSHGQIDDETLSDNNKPKGVSPVPGGTHKFTSVGGNSYETESLSSIDRTYLANMSIAHLKKELRRSLGKLPITMPRKIEVEGSEMHISDLSTDG